MSDTQIEKAQKAALILRRDADSRASRPDGTTEMRDLRADALADLAELVLALAGRAALEQGS